MQTAIKINEEAARFEAEVDGHLLLIDYELVGNSIRLVHTGVPKELEGRGLGSQIVKFALDYAKTKGLKVIPRCPFVRSYIDRHEEYRELVADQ